MEAISRAERLNESLFVGFRNILIKEFINPKVNAEVILQGIKDLKVDKAKIISKIKNLSEDEWSLNYLIDVLKELDSIMGVDDEFLRKNALDELDDKNLLEVKWELMKRMMVDYTRFSKEFYDSLKYSQNSSLSKEKYLLMIELMEALLKIHITCKELKDKFHNKTFNKTSFNKFMKSRMAVEHILLRINFILLNMDKKDKLEHYTKVLSLELIEFSDL